MAGAAPRGRRPVHALPPVRARRPLPTLLPLLLLVAASTACSGVVFEDSPYAVRDLRVAWSEQEGLTFLTWKLGPSADAGRVRFELEAQGRSPTLLDLAAAPFPAEPRRCDQALCFQYQVPGRLSFEAGARPLTSVLADGRLAGPEPVVVSVERTFDVAAFSFGRNDRLELDLWDWFQERDVPIRRTFQWQLVEDAGGCAAPEGPWRIHQGVVTLDPAWTATPSCVAFRPARADGSGPHVAVPLTPTAETRRLPRHYRPEEVQDPVVYALTFDLQIPDPGRCADVQTGLMDLVDAAMAERDPDARRLGPYRPVDASGAPLDGCLQVAGRRLPLEEALADVRKVRGEVVDPVRILWIHLHNLELPPSEEILADLERLLRLTEEAAGALPWPSAVAPPSAIDFLPPESVVRWRPVGDETLAADLANLAGRLLPFRTQLHEGDTEVAVAAPLGGRPPQAFKLCHPIPHLDRVGAGADSATWPAVLAWPALGEPYFTVDLDPQHKVPFADYVVHDVSFVLEVCDAFCDAPFRLQDGTVVPDWSADPRCRRVEAGEDT